MLKLEISNSGAISFSSSVSVDAQEEKKTAPAIPSSRQSILYFIIRVPFCNVIRRAEQKSSLILLPSPGGGISHRFQNFTIKFTFRY